MVSKEELKSKLVRLEDAIGLVIELWEEAVQTQDEINITDDEFVASWKTICEVVDRLERLRGLFMDKHAEIKERILKIERSNI